MIAKREELESKIKLSDTQIEIENPISTFSQNG
jgi:hypothetical protein